MQMVIGFIMRYFGILLLGFFGSIGVLFLVSQLQFIDIPESVKIYIVQSGSMEPDITVGSVVIAYPTRELLSPIPASQYGVNDVITYHSGESITTHRIVAKTEIDNKFYYQTKGDANNSTDKTLVAESDVVGEVAFTIPYLGKIFAYARKPVGYMSMVLVPSLYILGSELLTIINELKKNKKNVANLVAII